jgi:hypothetical protein
MTDGIYTLANDVVCEQLVALLNSIEVNVGADCLVCIIPYDDRLEKVKAAIANRKNVQILEDFAIIRRWEDFSRKIWQSHPSILKVWQEKGIEGVYRLGMHRRFCGFDLESPFDRFIYFDGDVLVLNSLDYIFERLNSSDFIVYDFQYKDPSHVYNVKSEKLLQIFPQDRIDLEIFCAGFFASKRGLFPEERQAELLKHLANGEAEILYPNGPDQSILNYITMRSKVPIYNFSLNLPPEKKTGCAVTSPHFELQNNLLYDRGKQLTYLHYIGVPSWVFTKVCAGDNIDFPYREIFLHYRYLHEPEKRPKFIGKPKPYDPPPSLTTKVLRKLGLKN